MIENVLSFKLSLSFFHFMRNCKKLENKNLFGGTLCINLIINAKTGPKDVDDVNEIYKNENDSVFSKGRAKIHWKYRS